MTLRAASCPRSARPSLSRPARPSVVPPDEELAAPPTAGALAASLSAGPRMELLLVRHAIAFERNARRWPTMTSARSAPAASTRARQAAAGLKRLTRRPARVLVSPLLRTRQTAALLTQCAGWPEALACEALRPGTAPEKLLAHLPRSRRARIARHRP